jgi:hypothetical protein
MMAANNIDLSKENTPVKVKLQGTQPGQESPYIKVPTLQNHTTSLEAVLNEVLGKEALSMKDEFKTALHKAKANLMEALKGEAQRIVEEALAEEIGELAQQQAAAQESATQSISSKPSPPPAVDIQSPAPQPQAIQADQEDTYQGVVKLTLNSHSTPRQMVNFVAELCQNPALRLLRMEGNGAEQAPDVWLALREPMDLKKVLKGMKEVELVDASSGETSAGGTRTLNVTLGLHSDDNGRTN